MAKEKISETEIKNREFIFIYEIIGVCLILVCLISVFRLGFLGKYGMLIFRLLFGNWYFLFLGIMGFLGIYFLFMHHRFEFTSIRYLGVILILFSLIVLSHFSMHNFVEQFDSNPFTTTISLYFDYFKNSQNEMLIGGGIVGCVFFYLLYFLLSKIGTIFVCIFLIFLGVVFMTKRTIVDFFKLIKKIFSRCFGGAFSLSKKIKDKIKIYNSEYKIEQKKNKNKLLKKKYLINQEINLENEYFKADKVINNIKNVLNHLNIFYNDITYMVCLHITVYFISTFQNVNYEVLKLSLNKFLHNEYLIRFDEINRMIIIEVNNDKGFSLNMYDAVKYLNSNTNEKSLIIGINDRNDFVKIDSSLLIISNNDLIYRNYLYSLIVLPLFCDNFINFDLVVFDLNKNFSSISNLVSNYYDKIDNLKEIKNELDEVLVKLENNRLSKIDDYNKMNKDIIRNKIIYINGVEHIVNNTLYNKYLEYFILSGSNIGYYFVIGCNDSIDEFSILLRSLNNKLFLQNDFKLSKKYFSGGILSKINKNIEGILKSKDLVIRISLLMIKEEEIKKIASIK